MAVVKDIDTTTKNVTIVDDMDDLQVGDIVTWNSGYSMVIPNFGRVIRRTPCMAEIAILRCYDETDRYGQQGFRTPTDQETGNVVKARKNKRGHFGFGGDYVYKWNGRKLWFDYCD